MNKLSNVVLVMFKLPVRKSIDVKCLIFRICTEKRLLFVLILTALPFGFKCLNSGRRGCHVYTSSNVHIADCSLLEMPVNVPNDLDPGVEVMNLSGNHLANISDRSFERYKETLVALDLSNMTLSKSRNVTYDDRSFVGLRKLEYLDISHSCIARHNFRFPSSLKVLKLENCELNSLNFSHVRALEELYAASCKLLDLPVFYKQAPIKFLDLRYNTLPKLRLETIASFCQLKQLRLKIPDGEGLQSPKAYCQCMLIESWLTNTGVKHEQLNCTRKDKNDSPPKLDINDRFVDNFVSGLSVRKSNSFSNEKTENITVALQSADLAKNQNCPAKPSESVMKLRRDCLEKISPHIIAPVKTNWMFIGAAVLAVFAVSISTFIYSRRRLQQKRKKKKIEPNHEGYEEDEEEAEEVYHYDHGFHEYGHGHRYHYK